MVTICTFGKPGRQGASLPCTYLHLPARDARPPWDSARSHEDRGVAVAQAPGAAAGRHTGPATPFRVLQAPAEAGGGPPISGAREVGAGAKDMPSHCRAHAKGGPLPKSVR